MNYNTYNLPRSYEESGKHSHSQLDYGERDGGNRTPQHYKTYNTQSQLTGDAMVQCYIDNINDN